MKRHIINIVVFALIVFGFSVFWLASKKPEIIASERRKAATLPPISEIFKEEFSEKFEKHMLDTFPLREGLRKINTAFRLNILKQGDVDKIYEKNGHLSKYDYPLDEGSALYVAEKINAVRDKYFPENKVYYSVIPDKNYFLANALSADYNKMLSIMSENVNAEYIDIFKNLSIENYYFGDTHWKQETILPVADTILKAMGNTAQSAPYTEKLVGDFKGVYASQAALDVYDVLYCLENEYVTGATVSSAEHGENLFVYQTEKFSGTDPYDVYLGGAEAVLDVKRPLKNGEEEKHLVLFRDSFGSSIAPLFLKSYSHITLIDLRYIHSSILSEFVNFENADVLFLYNTQIINSGRILK